MEAPVTHVSPRVVTSLCVPQVTGDAAQARRLPAEPLRPRYT
jgi:hypothetical protein